MKIITVEVEVEDHITKEEITEKVESQLNQTAPFKSRKRISWISFLILISIIYLNLFYEFKNEALIQTITFGLCTIVLSYFGTVSYEFVKSANGVKKNNNNMRVR